MDSRARAYLVGIFSSGSIDDPCYFSRRYGRNVFTRVAYFTFWILDNLGENKDEYRVITVK